MNLPKYILFLPVVFLLFSCKDPGKKPTPAPSGNYIHGVWIINEGGFTYGNASVDFYHTDKDSLERDVFYNTNKRPLGDVLQNMVHWNNSYLMVVNNSNKIEIADDKSFKSQGIIGNLSLPRYILPVTTSKAYLTSETAKGINIIDLGAMKITGLIPYNPNASDAMKSWTNQLAVYGNNAYITAVETGHLLVINTQTDKITDTIHLSVGAKEIVIDKENKLWVLCNGFEAVPVIASMLYRVDPLNNKIIGQYAFPYDNMNGTANLQINSTGDTVYYNYKGILKMGIHETTLSLKTFIPGNFYGLGIDTQTNAIYAGDDKGFTQTGVVSRYSSSGKLQKTLGVGVGPNGFLFVP